MSESAARNGESLSSILALVLASGPGTQQRAFPAASFISTSGWSVLEALVTDFALGDRWQLGESSELTLLEIPSPVESPLSDLVSASHRDERLAEVVDRANARERFSKLATTWRSKTAHQSSIFRRAMDPAYQQIIGMGASALPFIFDDLAATKDQWFWALSSITGENPVKESERGNLPAMVRSWLEWARNHGYLTD